MNTLGMIFSFPRQLALIFIKQVAGSCGSKDMMQAYLGNPRSWKLTLPHLEFVSLQLAAADDKTHKSCKIEILLICLISEDCRN